MKALVFYLFLFCSVVASAYFGSGTVTTPIDPPPSAIDTPTNTPTSTATATATPTFPACGAQQTGVFSSNFDNVTAPALPAGWTAANTVDPDGVFWQTSNTGQPSPPANSSPNAAWINDPPAVSDRYLQSGTFFIFEASWGQLRFQHNFDLQNGFDGAVLEISTDFGPFVDITTVGGFAAGGYNSTIASGTGNPLAGRQAWSGSSNGFMLTIVNLPNMTNARLRFRMASDNSGSGEGWRVDDITITECHFFGTMTSTPTATRTPTLTPTQTATATNTSTATNTATDTPTPTPTASPAVRGTVTYGNAIDAPTPRFVSNVTITANGSPTINATTAAPGATAGQYSLTGFGAGSYTVTPTKTGGVNSITSFDAARIAQHVSGTSLLNATQLIVADVSNNGSVTSFDAAQIARYVAATPPFGITGTWKFTPVNRTYSSITGNLSGEDYSALLMGEVSGNWTNTGARPTNGFHSAVLSWLTGGY